MSCWLLGVSLQLRQAHAAEASWGLAAVGAGLLLLACQLALVRSKAHKRAIQKTKLSADKKAEKKAEQRPSRLAVPLLKPGLQVWCPAWCLWCLAAGLMGWGQAQWRAANRLAQAWPVQLNQQAFELTGRIDAMPQPHEWGDGVEVAVMGVSLHGRQWVPGQPWALPGVPAMAVCPPRVSLSWRAAPEAEPGPAEEGRAILMPGQVWRWQVLLREPGGLSNPGGFDSELWHFQQGLRAQGRVTRHGKGQEDSLPPLLLEAPRWHSPSWIDRWRTQLRNQVLRSVPDARLAGLIIGLTVGDPTAIAQADWQTLRTTGTAHLASISGLHITMMGWLVAALVSRLWRLSPELMLRWPAPVAANWLGLAGAGCYALLAGWGVPAQRTVLMLALVTWLGQGGRRWPWPLVLLAAAVAVTALDPWALTQAGFWLSFAAVGLLMLSGGDGPGRLPEKLSLWQRTRQGAQSLLRTQAVASVGLAPLSLVFFQTVSVVGLAANLVCIPLFSFVITPLALLGYVLPGVWTLLSWVVAPTMSSLSGLSQVAWAVAQGASVSLWAAGLGLAAGAWMLAPWPRAWRFAALPALLPLLWPTSLSQLLSGPPEGEVQVIAADIGQGTAVLVRTARHALLFDAGPGVPGRSDAGQRVLVGLLRSVGVRQLDEMLISHGDADHVGGAASVLKAVPVRHLRSSLPPDHDLLTQLSPIVGRPPHTPCQVGQRWTWDGVEFEVLHPTTQDLAERDSLGDNALSCVLRVRAHGRQVLLTGDIEAEQEAALLERAPESLRSEVLLVPHHGSKTSSTQDFLQAVAPKVAVIQAGAHNSYGHPNPTVLARYQARQIPLAVSPSCGAWVWSSAEEAPAAQHGTMAGLCWREASAHYWARYSALK
jgi:competence protein ComEC